MLTIENAVKLNNIVTPQYAYVLGASFDVPMLENENRDYVVHFLKEWLDDPSGQQEWNVLLKWCRDPAKPFNLVRDCLRVYADRQNSILQHTKPVPVLYPAQC